MENKEKNNVGVIVILSVVIVILAILCVLFVTNTISLKSGSTNNGNLSNNNVSDNNVESNNYANNNYNETDFIRQTEIVLVKEPDCTGQHSTSLTASINSNGNIGIAQDKGAEEVIVGNAKYLYSVNVIACDNVKLYYITNDNELYLLDNPSSSALNQKGVKVTDNKIAEFLGIDNRTDGNYLKVLNTIGEVEYYKYFSSHN